MSKDLIKKNESEIVEYSEENLSGIIVREENKMLAKVIKSKNDFCYAVFNEKSPKIKDIVFKDFLILFNFFIKKTATEIMGIDQPSDAMILVICEKIYEKYPHCRFAEIEKAIEMGYMGELFDDEKKTIKCYNNLNAVWVFSCINSYEKMKPNEISKVRIAEAAEYRSIAIDETASDTTWEKFSQERKKKLKEEGKIIVPFEVQIKRKINQYTEILDKREKK